MTRSARVAMEKNLLGARAFPVWAEVDTVDEVIVGDLGPLGLDELAAVLDQRLIGEALLFDVDRIPRNEPMDLTCDLGGPAPHLRFVGPNASLVQLGALSMATALLSQWDFTLVAPSSVAHPHELLARLTERRDSGAVALSATSDADVFVRGHDDCYVHVEARSAELVYELIAVLLATAAAVAHRRHQPIEAQTTAITVPSNDIVETLLGTPQRLTIDQNTAGVTEYEITLPVAHAAWRFNGTVEPPAVTATYELPTARWFVREV